MLQRPVDDLKDDVVLPAAEPERDAEHNQAGDQSRAELIEMLDERQAPRVADRAQPLHHASAAAGVARRQLRCESGAPSETLAACRRAR